MTDDMPEVDPEDEREYDDTDAIGDEWDRQYDAWRERQLEP
jgi:hypothetical protein